MYLLLRLGVATLGRLKRPARMRLARAIGRCAARWLPYRRKLILEQIGSSFPEWSESRRRRTLTESYTHIAAFVLEALALPRWSLENIRDAIVLPMENEERIEGLIRSGQGFILLSAHMGNVEIGAAHLTSIGVNVGGVAKPLFNPWLDRWAVAQRARVGIATFSSEENFSRICRHIKKGGALAIVGDQDARRRGIFVPFFGRDASTYTGAARFAVRLGIPILPIWSQRTPEGRIAIRIGEPIHADPQADRSEEIERITRLHVALLEKEIRRDPAQYWWIHRRWKTRPKPGRADGALQAESELAAEFAEDAASAAGIEDSRDRKPRSLTKQAS
jgi:KDO2-lipid IV(A) lauroyltransferase